MIYDKFIMKKLLQCIPSVSTAIIVLYWWKKLSLLALQLFTHHVAWVLATEFLCVPTILHDLSYFIIYVYSLPLDIFCIQLLYYWILLTLWELAYKYIVPRFRPKTSSFQLPYQCHISSVDGTRELFNGSNGLDSLLVCTRKKIFLFGGCRFFVSDVISEVVFGPFWLMLPRLGPNRYSKVFCSSFHWKLGSRPSLLTLWSTFWCFWFKGYDLK